MEEKNMRELNPDEMDRVSGGSGHHDRKDEKDNPVYWMSGRSCPTCHNNDLLSFSVRYHTDNEAIISCEKCCARFTVYL